MVLNSTCGNSKQGATCDVIPVDNSASALGSQLYGGGLVSVPRSCPSPLFHLLTLFHHPSSRPNRDISIDFGGQFT